MQFPGPRPTGLQAAGWGSAVFLATPLQGGENHQL